MKFDIISQLTNLPKAIYSFVKDHMGIATAHMLGWLSILLLNCASIPTLLSVLLGHSDKLPPVDLMVFIWVALITLFFKSLIQRNYLNVATICLGFSAQTILMGFILFK